MEEAQKILELEQELRKVKGELLERQQDLSLYQKEIQKLNGEVSKILLNLDKDLSMVRKVFKYLVPTQFPHISGFQFSTKFMSGMRFSGDYIDVFEQRDKFKFNLILSSSTGPALTALLIAFLLKHGRDLGGEGTPSPTDFINKVLEEIEAKNEKLSDIQVACLLVDKKSYKVSYKIHGNVSCFYQSGDDLKVVDLVESKNKEGVLDLNAYDRVVLLSPGLVGSTNAQGAIFSATPVLEAMASVPTTQSVHDLRNEIFYKLDQHLDGRKPMQDVSIIIMSVDNNIIKLA